MRAYGDRFASGNDAGAGAGRRRLTTMGVALPSAFLVAVVVADYVTAASYFELSAPLIIVMPALAAAMLGVPGAVVFTALSAVATYLLADLEGWHHTEIFYAQLIGLGVVFTVSLLPGHLRTRRERTVERLRSVADAVQRAVLLPIPERIGCLWAAADYLSADEEAQIGGDLYDVVETPYGVRMIMGDVRGKGVAAVASATSLLGAFREAAPYAPDLPHLAGRLEDSVRRYNERAGLGGEEFITAALVSISSCEKVELLCCGHPGPLLVRGARPGAAPASGSDPGPAAPGNNPAAHAPAPPAEVVEVVAAEPSPPLGVSDLGADGRRVETVRFAKGDHLLLYTDGVTEARDARGEFYPLAERVRAWPGGDAKDLVRYLVDDLIDYTGGRLRDDAALLTGRRADEAPG